MKKDQSSKKDLRKTISPIIGSYLKELRLRKNIRQTVLGEHLDISGAYIGFVENAKRLPSTEVLAKYADFFEIEISHLMNLRELTVFETVELLGDETPPAIKNERNMIVHALDSNSEIVEKERVTVKLSIGKDGSIQLNGQDIDVNDIPEVLQKISSDFKNKNE